jgi:hypothetical protein
LRGSSFEGEEGAVLIARILLRGDEVGWCEKRFGGEVSSFKFRRQRQKAGETACPSTPRFALRSG